MRNLTIAGAFSFLLLFPVSVVAQNLPVKMIRHDDRQAIDIYVGGELFTSYIYPSAIKKPVLYPLRASDGTLVTRGYPLDPQPGERIDHPHHIGLWLNYGNVNGLDFWNNSDAIDPDRKDNYGTILHKAVKKIKNGAKGVLEVEMDWVDSKGTVLIRENARFVFSGDESNRCIDRITSLTALDEDVSMADSKEGFLGLRVARFLEAPSNRPERLVDASGKPSDTPVLNNEGATGTYISGGGKRGDDVWGSRAKWTRLEGAKDGKRYSIAIIDHPANPGYPTYWHARGYGLFAANPLGQKELSGGKEEMNFKIEAGKTAVFRHRIVIHCGDGLDSAALDEEFSSFAKTK